MPSLRSRIVSFAVRNRRLLSGKFHRSVFDMNTSIYDFRAQSEKEATLGGRLPEGVEVIPVPEFSLNAEWIIPDGVLTDTTMLYVHGGGYVSGSCSDHRHVVSRFVDRCGIRTFLYEYRLAPEHPFPAALDDSVDTYQWLLENDWEPSNIIVAGESSGGGLALALLLALKERKLPMPAAVVAISPWTDLTCSSESHRTKREASVMPVNAWTVFSKHYAGEQSLDHPLISPLYGDLSGLPPLFINSGEEDELFDDGRRFAEKAAAAGVDVTFHAGKNMIHCYPLLAPFFPEAIEAQNEICEFINKALPQD